eukprot:SAG22_NODE_218_length_14885_cov_24.733699_4_plen_740_part_00
MRTSAGSKVLISTRMKALLAGGHQVEVGLPSPADSARMLLAAADADTTGRQPSGVHEIVNLCGRLALALGIAGRLAATLDLVGTQDWSDMIGVLKEELRESHSGGVEEGTIRASLKGLKGSAQQQANVRSLLNMFALVPEDTQCPLDVMLLMFNAVHESASASMMHIRKWLRILINHSLVLGTIDRPSVHDLVLDFAAAQHRKDELRDAHRRIVEAFRAARPADCHGRRRFDAAQKDNPTSVYVCNEVEHHVSQADMEQDELGTLEWLLDVPQDGIVAACARTLGVDRLSSLASRAEASSDWWLAARYWAALQVITDSLSSGGAGFMPMVKAIEAMEALGAIPESDSDKLDFLLATVAVLASAFDYTGDLSRRPKLVKRVLESKAGLRDPMAVGIIKQISFVSVILAGDLSAGGKGMLESVLFTLKAASSDEDPVMRAKCLMSAYNNAQLSAVFMMSPEFDWDEVYGVDGETLVAAFAAYDWDVQHPFLVQTWMADWFIAFCMPVAPLALHWADMARVNDHFDKAMLYVRRMIDVGPDDPTYVSEAAAQICAAVSWSALVWSCRMPPGDERREAVAAMMAACDMTWQKAASKMDHVASFSVWLRRHDDRTMTQHYQAADTFTYCAMCGHVLMSASDSRVSRPSDVEIMAGLPSVEEIRQTPTHPGKTQGSACIMNLAHCSHLFINAFLSCAAVCDQLGRHSEALAYATAGLVTDFAQAGEKMTQHPSPLYCAHNTLTPI